MLKLVSDDVPSVEQFMKKYRVRTRQRTGDSRINICPPQMDHPAALHRLEVGVPATVEHASGEGGAETAQAVAETTQASFATLIWIYSY